MSSPATVIGSRAMHRRGEPRVGRDGRGGGDVAADPEVLGQRARHEFIEVEASR